MASLILDTIEKEPPLLNWLHTNDPDRQISPELIKASATYVVSSHSTACSPADIASPPTPPSPSLRSARPPSSPPSHPAPSTPLTPNASLFVPMYRRNHFILGQLYSPLSPNALALSLLAPSDAPNPPLSISRRFVVDLSFPTLNFLEYEWFSDGKLSVTMHCVDEQGLYSGENMLLDKPPSPTSHVYTMHDLLGNKNRPSATKIIMRIKAHEHPPCQICYSQGLPCSCPQSMRDHLPTRVYDPPTSWEAWTTALSRTRSGITSVTASYSVTCPTGSLSGEETLLLNQKSELGFGTPSSYSNRLLTMFMQSADMLVSHPSTDSVMRSAEEKRRRIEQPPDVSSSESEQSSASPPVSVSASDRLIEPLSQSTPCPTDPLADPPPLLEHSLTSQDHQPSTSSPRPSPPTPPLPNTSVGPHNYVVADSTQQNRRSHADRGVPSASLNPAQFPLHQTQTTETTTHNRKPRRQIVSTKSGPSHRAAQDSSPKFAGSRGPNSTPVAKRRTKSRGRLIQCPLCPRVFDHKGHYNEHRRCVHDKVKPHKCAFVNCQSRFFKPFDRDRHMRSKHDFTAVLCSKCDMTLPDKAQLEAHIREVHKPQGKHSCGNCNAVYPAVAALRQHAKTCRTQ